MLRTFLYWVVRVVLSFAGVLAGGFLAGTAVIVCAILMDQALRNGTNDHSSSGIGLVAIPVAMVMSIVGMFKGGNLVNGAYIVAEEGWEG